MRRKPLPLYTQLAAGFFAVLTALAFWGWDPRDGTVGGAFSLLGSFPVALSVSLLGLWGYWYSVYHGNFGLLVREERGSLSGVALVASSLVSLLAAIGWAKTLRHGRSRWTWLALGCFAVETAAGVISSFKGAILAPALLAMVVYINIRRAVPARAVAGLVLAYALFAFPFVTTLRQVSRARSASEAVTESIDMLSSRAWFDGSSVTLAADSLNRGLLGVLSSIVTDDRVGDTYEPGSTYLIGFERSLPRVLAPERQRATIANWIGKRYGQVSRDNDVANVSPTQLGEMYLNFGLFGVLCGMFLTGLLAAWVDGPFTRYAGVAVAAWLWRAGVFGQESVLGQSYLPVAIQIGLIWCVLAIVSALRLRARTVSSRGTRSRPSRCR